MGVKSGGEAGAGSWSRRRWSVEGGGCCKWSEVGQKAGRGEGRGRRTADSGVPLLNPLYRIVVPHPR